MKQEERTDKVQYFLCELQAYIGKITGKPERHIDELIKFEIASTKKILTIFYTTYKLIELW